MGWWRRRGISRGDGDGHGVFALSVLSSAEGFAGEDELSVHGAGGAWGGGGGGGYCGVMVTDTAFLRYPYYHQQKDLPEKMNFPCMARVVHGVVEAAGDIAG